MGLFMFIRFESKQTAYYSRNVLTKKEEKRSPVSADLIHSSSWWPTEPGYSKLPYLYGKTWHHTPNGVMVVLKIWALIIHYFLHSLTTILKKIILYDSWDKIGLYLRLL